jgi:hypothetical protein
MKLVIDKVTENDLKVINRSICDGKAEIYGVASRCKNGFPQVAVLNPVKDSSTGELNSDALDNILWLTCSAIYTKITALEQNGVSERVSQLLSSDRQMLTEMMNAHAHYYYFRKEVYRRIAGHDYSEDKIRFFDAGIGGERDVKHVNCLHSHYAHFMICQSNIVGRAIEGLVGCSCCEEGGLCRK